MPNDTDNSNSLAKLRVMVIEDDVELLELIETLLADMGVTQIVKANDGASALKIYDQKDHSFDLIICDWQMPKKSGLDVLRELKTREPDIQFVMLTSKTDNEDVAEAIDLGADMYIKKPITRDSFKSQINFFLLNKRINT